MNKQLFDSTEEDYFYEWLLELQNNSYIDYIHSNKKSYKLNKVVLAKAKLKKKQVTLIKQKTYTPDFIIRFTEKARGIFFYDNGDEKSSLFYCHNNRRLCYIDVKGSFTRNLTSSITFPDRQLLMYTRHNIYVNKVIPIGKDDKCLFAKTFTPTYVDKLEKYKVKPKDKTKSVGDSKLKFPVKTLSQYEQSCIINRW